METTISGLGMHYPNSGESKGEAFSGSRGGALSVLDGCLFAVALRFAARVGCAFMFLVFSVCVVCAFSRTCPCINQDMFGRRPQ